MGSVRKPLCFAVLLLFSWTITGFASPLNCKLLSLVPPGAGIVAGFENYPDPHRHGQLLLTTHNNRVDVTDWLALTGVDSKRFLDEGIEVASTPKADGMLTEHLLLVEGQFDKDRIYRAAELNGGQRGGYESAELMIVQPFTREKGEMEDVRWLVILENRIGMLGTPLLVKQALERYETRTGVDPELAQRLSQLPDDVSSWNLLVSMPADTRNIFMHQGSRWSPLVNEAEILMVGARFGPKVRVDFLLHAGQGHGAEFFKQKTASFQQLFASVFPHRSGDRSLGKVSYAADSVKGSVRMTQKQFEMWGEQGNVEHGLQGPHPVSHGE